MVRWFVLGLIAAGSAAMAEEKACNYPYSFFDAAVPHFDLAACPASVNGEGRLCRATVGTDSINVYVFFEDNDGDRCLVTVRTFYDDEFELELKDG